MTTKSYVVTFEIKGTGYLHVDAESEEDALDKAWEQYHAGTELEQVEWDVDDAYAEED